MQSLVLMVANTAFPRPLLPLTHPALSMGAQAVMLGGQVQAMLLFGGERTDFWSEDAVLSMDVYGTLFSSGRMTVSKLRTVDEYGLDCELRGLVAEDLVDLEPVCPEARRDVASAIIGNSGGNNGRLLLFGGMGLGTATVSPFRSYLENGQVELQAFNDLWYLDLDELTEVLEPFPAPRHLRMLYVLVVRVVFWLSADKIFDSRGAVVAAGLYQAWRVRGTDVVQGGCAWNEASRQMGRWAYGGHFREPVCHWRNELRHCH